MKLLLINSIGRTKWGGGEKWMLMAAKNLIQRGHEVYISCTSNSILEAKAKADNLPVLPVNIYSDFNLIALMKLRKYFIDKQFDVVIGCQNRDVRLTGFLVKKMLKTNTLVFSRQGVQLLSNALKYKYTFMPFCDGIITNTKSIKAIYDSYGWWNNDYVKVIYNGVESDFDQVNEFDYSQYIKHSTKPFIVLSTGRLSTQKGFKYLIEAAKDVVKVHPNVYFFIAGKGKLRNELLEQIARNNLKSNVFLIGFQENVSSLLKGTNLFVLPSLYEGMPNSVMEAMAFGIPVISTNVNGVSELMQDKEHGFIIPSADVPSIVNHVLKMVEDENYREMGKAGQSHVRDHFTVDKMVDKLEMHLISEIDKKNSGRL